jgi:uncharacterized membrane protein YjgN (DUF898 family)
MNKKVVFTGAFGEFFIISLGLLILSVITFGIAFPYWFYWSHKYFFTNLYYNGKLFVFTGHFADYFLKSLGLLVLSVITFGLAVPYWFYWSYKYFFARLELAE